MAENRHGTAEIAERFAEQGYCFPIEVLSPGEAADARARLEALEAAGRGSKLGNKAQLNYPHVIFRFANAIVRHPRLLDAVEALAWTGRIRASQNEALYAGAEEGPS